MPITCLADEIAETYEFDAEEFEQILRDVVSQGKSLEAPHYAFGLSRLGYDQSKAREESRRVTRSMRRVAIIGSPAQQAAKEEAAKIAAEVAEKELPKLLKQREAIDAKITAIERDRDLTAKRVEETREELAELPKDAPPFLRKRVAAAETLLNAEGVGAELRAATARLHELKCVLNVGGVYDRPEMHIDALRRLCPDAVTSAVQGRMMSYQYSPAWPGIKADCEREYSEVTARLPELQAAFDTALAEVRMPLIDYFMNPQENE